MYILQRLFCIPEHSDSEKNSCYVPVSCGILNTETTEK